LEQLLIDTLTQFSHQPLLVYSLVFLFMYASSFGFPVPEEVVLLTLGFLAHMAMNPSIYPPSESAITSGALDGVNVHLAAWLAFVAVFSSDVLVYFLGRVLGKKVFQIKFVNKVMTQERQEKVSLWTNRFGPWAGGVFRFTPGIRFPGHLTCGILKVPARKFLAIDGFAALISVPTQVYLVGFYGKEIIDLIKKYQLWVIALLLIAGLWYFRQSVFGLFRGRPAPIPNPNPSLNKPEDSQKPQP
jgi:membrane protein DedA with SNARE-associated domain